MNLFIPSNSSDAAACKADGEEEGDHGSSSGRENESFQRSVIAIDFQWTGGSGECGGMQDVAMHLFHSVHPDCLEGGGERALLTHYYECLCLHLKRRSAQGLNGTRRPDAEIPQPQSLLASSVLGRESRCGGASEYPWAVAEKHYALALVDYARVVVGGFWARGGCLPEAIERRANNMNCGLPYRNHRSMRCFVESVEANLAFLEQMWNEDVAAISQIKENL